MLAARSEKDRREPNCSCSFDRSLRVSVLGFFMLTFGTRKSDHLNQIAVVHLPLSSFV